MRQRGTKMLVPHLRNPHRDRRRHDRGLPWRGANQVVVRHSGRSALVAREGTGGTTLLGRRRECEALDRLVGGRGVRHQPRHRSYAVTPASARARCWATCPTASPAGASRRPRRRVRDGAGVQRAPSAVRADAGSPRSAARPAARRARDGVRAERRARARPVPGRARRAEPAGRGRPRSSRWSASSTTRSGSTRPPHRSSVSSARRLSPSGSRSCARPATGIGDDVLAGLPELSDRRARRQRRARAAARQRARAARRRGLRPDRRREPRQPARAPRAATHLERRRSRRRVRVARQPAGGGQDRGELRAAPPLAPVRDAAARPRRGRRAPRRPRAAPPRRRGARDRHGRSRRRRSTPGCSRSAGASSSRIRSSDPPPIGCGAADDRQRVHRALADATDAEHRPGPARLAPRPSHARARRGCRRRTRALGRPGAGSRRTRGRRRVPRRAPTELTPDPARRVRAGARGSARQRPGRGVRRGSDAVATADDGPLDEFAARADRPAARSAGVRLEPRQRGDPAAARSRPSVSSRWISGSRARRTSTRSPRRCSGPGSTTASACPRSHGRPARAPRRPTAEPTAADLLLDGLVALTDDYDDGRSALPAGVARSSPATRLARGAAALAVAGLRRRPGGVGRRERVLAVAATASRSRGRRARSANWRSRSARAPRCSSSAASSPRGLDGRGDASRSRRRPASARRRTARLILARLAGRRARGARPDREHDPRGRRPRRGHWRSPSASTRAPSCATASASTKRRSPPPARPATYQEVVAENWGLSELIEAAARTGQNRSGDGRAGSAGREGAGDRNRLGARASRPAHEPCSAKATPPRTRSATRSSI